MHYDILSSCPDMTALATNYVTAAMFSVSNSATATPAWMWMAAATIIASWSAFLYALTRRHWNFAGLIVGVFHMLFAATLSFAPFRSWFDSNYLGLGLGFLRFDGHRATLPCTLMLAWALAAALIVVIKGRGRWMVLVVAGDAFWAVNFGGSLLSEDALKSKVQLGDEATFRGPWALLILVAFYVLPFVLSAIWCARRLRDSDRGQRRRAEHSALA